MVSGTVSLPDGTSGIVLLAQFVVQVVVQFETFWAPPEGTTGTTGTSAGMIGTGATGITVWFLT